MHRFKIDCLAYDFAPGIRATYTFGLWRNDADSTVQTYLTNSAGQPTFAGLAGFASGTSTLVQQHTSHSLALRTDTKRPWDFELSASRYHFDRDEQRTPTTGHCIFPQDTHVLTSWPHMHLLGHSLKSDIFHADGTPYAEGETLKNPELAATLRLIAKGGPKAFYSGVVAQAIVDKVDHAPVNPGGMKLSDLASYQAREREPVCGAYRGNNVCSMGPPSSGGIAVLQILEMLERSWKSRSTGFAR